MKTTTSRRLIGLVAGPVAVAGIIGGAMGLAAVAHASGAAQPIVYPHAARVQTPVSKAALSRARAVETAPWPPSHQAPLLGTPASKTLGDR